MTTNNADNFTNPVSVNTGGTGDASFTAYSVICAGTTSTAALQNVSGVGNTGDFLTSNGASNLPSWQAPSGISYALNLTGNNQPLTPADSTTYFMLPLGSFTGSTSSGAVIQRMIVPKSSTITSATGLFSVQGTLGSNENGTLNIRINNTTNVAVSSTVKLNASSVIVTNTSLSTSVSAGDYLEFTFTTPAWATNPTNVLFNGTIFLS